MIWGSPSRALIIFAASVAAQTFTDCDPLKKTCPAEPALGRTKVQCDYTTGECSEFYALEGTTITYDDKGALFSIESKGQAPTIATSKFIFFGRLQVELQASLGPGVVTSVVLQSGDLDEIDWEWLGGDNAQVQTNYFGKGDTTTYDRGAFHPVSEPLTSFHTYTIEWTSKKVDWIIDGVVIRTLTYEEAQGGARFPQTPMEVKLGTWVAGLPGNSPGTIEWAGGLTDFSKGPFNAWYKSVSVIDYAGGDSPTTESVKEYIYGDKSGSWESIQVVKGESSEGDKDGEQSAQPTSGAASQTTTVSRKTTSSALPDTTSSVFSTPAVNSTSSTTSVDSTTTSVRTSSSTSSATTTTAPPEEGTALPEGPAVTTTAPGSGVAISVPFMLQAAIIGSALLLVQAL